MKGVKLTSKEHVSKQEWHVPLLSFKVYDVFNCRSGVEIDNFEDWFLLQKYIAVIE